MTDAHYQVDRGREVLDELAAESASIGDAAPSTVRPSGHLYESLVAASDETYLGVVDGRCGGIELVCAAVLAAMEGLHHRALAADRFEPGSGSYR